MSALIWFINGVPGAGKTTVADALAHRFPRSVRIRGDDLRDMVVRGRADVLGPPSDEMRLQYGLSWRLAAEMAAAYADAGFTVVIDDVAPAEAIAIYSKYLADRTLRIVLLAPALDVALERNAQRDTKPFSPEILAPVIQRMHAQLIAEHAGVVIDSSLLTVDATVDAILAAF